MLTKQKLLIFAAACLCAVGAKADWASTTVDGVNYSLDTDKKTAEVTWSSNDYSGDIVLPSTITYSSETYTVTTIGADAFGYCSDLTSVVLPETLVEIYSDAFSYSTSLTSIRIPASVTSIASGIFAGCTSLTAIEVDAANPNYASSDGVLYNKNLDELVAFPAGKASQFTIPSTVTAIGASAFKSCTNLTGVTIPEGVDAVGKGAFERCTALTSVVIPNSVTSLGSSAFQYCSSLESVTLSDNLTQITPFTFRACTVLTSISIPDNVTVVGEDAFIRCTSLATVRLGEKLKYLNSDCFYACGLKDVYCAATTVPYATRAFDDDVCTAAVLHVPTGTRDSYASTYGWMKFSTITENEVAGINGVTLSDATVSARDGKVVFSNLAAGERVSLYTTDGHLLKSATAASAGVVSLDAAQSVVVAKVGNRSFKLLTK